MDIDSDVDLETRVAKKYIQTQVENAIKHGLRLGQDDKRLMIQVEDNGVRRNGKREGDK
jgi:LytS/YehU family sensor histidine kinase